MTVRLVIDPTCEFDVSLRIGGDGACSIDWSGRTLELPPAVMSPVVASAPMDVPPVVVPALPAVSPVTASAPPQVPSDDARALSPTERRATETVAGEPADVEREAAGDSYGETVAPSLASLRTALPSRAAEGTIDASDPSGGTVADSDVSRTEPSPRSRARQQEADRAGEEGLSQPKSPAKAVGKTGTGRRRTPAKPERTSAASAATLGHADAPDLAGARGTASTSPKPTSHPASGIAFVESSGIDTVGWKWRSCPEVLRAIGELKRLSASWYSSGEGLKVEREGEKLAYVDPCSGTEWRAALTTPFHQEAPYIRAERCASAIVDGNRRSRRLVSLAESMQVPHMLAEQLEQATGVGLDPLLARQYRLDFAVDVRMSDGALGRRMLEAIERVRRQCGQWDTHEQR